MKPPKKKKPKIFAYAPRLIALLKRPGGITVEQATAAANANLETIRRQSLVELDKVIARIVAMREPLRDAPSPELTDKLYGLAGTVIGIAGSFGLDEVQAAAASMCELIDELDLQKRVAFEAVDVHLRGLQILRSPGQETSPQNAAAVLAGLAEVVRAVSSKRA
jgi:chemotaxis protein histidine kinase CheA